MINWFLFSTVVLYVGASGYECWAHGLTRDAAIYASFALTNSVLTFWRPT